MSLLFDQFVKGAIFGCQQCGQCILPQTGYVCPMTCPKGLRNGPCGGTLDGACEVLPDQPCVWLRIRERAQEPGDALHAPFDVDLIGTSSWNNFLRGRDRHTRLPHRFGDAAKFGDAADGAGQPSIFAGRFASPGPVVTYEITSPRSHDGLARIEKMVQRIHPYVDAINTTTNAGGVPSLHSLETARVVAATGIPPIVQFCGRDQDAAAFEAEARAALRDGFANVLALTGDWNPSTVRERDRAHWFPMDSLQMVDVLANLSSGFPKAPFIGVASNPYTTPIDVSVARLMAKIGAGARFTQTQVVTETTIFARWLEAVRAEPRGRHCRILASVPLVGKARPYEILQRLPGVRVAPEMARALAGGDDLLTSGMAYARGLVDELLKFDIDGIHLLNFGAPAQAVVDFIRSIRTCAPDASAGPSDGSSSSHAG